APEQRRDGRGAGAGAVGGQQALPAGLAAAQGRPRQHARRAGGARAMSTFSADREPLEQLAEEFAERYRRGERPSLTEYAKRYPDLAGEIRELFPALVLMEQFGLVAEPPTVPEAGPPAGAPGPGRLGEYRIL